MITRFGIISSFFLLLFLFFFICTFVVIKITFELFIHLFTKNRKPGSYSNQEHCRYGKSFVPKLFIQKKKYGEINARITFQAENPLKGWKRTAREARYVMRLKIHEINDSRSSERLRIRKKPLLCSQHFNWIFEHVENDSTVYFPFLS